MRFFRQLKKEKKIAASKNSRLAKNSLPLKKSCTVSNECKVEMLVRRLEEQTNEVEMLKEKVRHLEERIKNNDVDGDKYNQYNRETTRVLELNDDHTARNYAIRSDLDEIRNENKQLELKLEELRKKAQKYKKQTTYLTYDR